MAEESASAPIECDVYWSDVACLNARHIALLDATEVGRRRAYRHQADRDRFALGAALLRLVVSDRVDIAPGLIEVKRTCPTCGGPHGKPRVSGVEVSVAHSCDYAAVAVTSSSRVGIDIEAIRAVDYVSLIPALCAPEERADLVGREAFYRCWTRKESLLKAAGVGLAVPMCTLRVTPFDEAPRLLRSPSGFPAAAAMADVSPAPGYAGAVTVLSQGPVTFRTHSGSAEAMTSDYATSRKAFSPSRHDRRARADAIFRGDG